MTESQSPVRVEAKTGKKRQCQGESNDQENRPSEEIFNRYESQTDDYDSEFDRESLSVQGLNFDKVQKINNQCEMGLPLHENFCSSNFCRGTEKKSEIQTIEQMPASITAIVGKMSYDLSLKRHKLIKPSSKSRSLCSANNKPTELLFGDDLTKHVKDLTMTNKLKRNENYYQ